MFYIIITYYLLLLYANRKDRIVSFLLLFQIVSVASAIFIQLESYDDNLDSFINTIFIVVFNSLIILPWKNCSFIPGKFSNDKSGLAKIVPLTKMLLWISTFVFIVLLITSLILWLTIDDINRFKYADGESEYFYYNLLPFNVRFLLLADYLYVLSFFLLPLHFLHLYLGHKKMAILCWLFSLNLILYGLTFFSRWTVVLYISLYLFFYFYFKESLPAYILKKELKILKGVAVVIGSLFIFVSIARFGENSSFDSYEVPKESPVKNPTLYSSFDYLGQCNTNGLYLLNKYTGQTFEGKYAISSYTSILYGQGLINKYDFVDIKKKLWGNLFGNFTGFVTYTIYDMGIILGIIFCIWYYFYIKQKRKSSKLHDILLISLWIQLPLCSIFYSQLSLILFCLIFYIPICFYLKK